MENKSTKTTKTGRTKMSEPNLGYISTKTKFGQELMSKLSPEIHTIEAEFALMEERLLSRTNETSEIYPYDF